MARSDWDLVVDNIAYRPEEALLAARLFSGRVRRWVFISTASVYHAFSSPGEPVLEESWPGSPAAGPLKPVDAFPYGVLKWECEQAYRRAFGENGFPAVMLRFPIVTGPDDPTGRCQSYLWRIARGGPLILPDGGRHAWRFLWFADAARAILEAGEAPGIEGEAINVADLETVSLEQWVREASAALGATVKTIEIPMAWLDARGFPYEASPYASPAPFALSVEKARRLLGWKSTPVRDWIGELCAWYRERSASSENAVYWEKEKELAAFTDKTGRKAPVAFAPGAFSRYE